MNELLQQIKNEVAVTKGKRIGEEDIYWEEVCSRYAAACVEEKEKLILKLYHQCYDRATDYEILDDLKKTLTDNGYPYGSED